MRLSDLNQFVAGWSLLETTVEHALRVPGKGMALQDMREKIVIESVVLNPNLADSRFAKPRPEDAKEKSEEPPKAAASSLP